MTCPRCCGLMVPESFDDLCVYAGPSSFHGWRCISCGEILDPLIEKNRRVRGPQPVVHPDLMRELKLV